MGMIKVEAVVNRERVETVVSTVEAEVGHVGVTVFEALGHGRQSGISYDDPELPPKAFLTFIVPEDKAQPVLEAICAGAKSGNESGDGLAWMSSVYNVRHNRTGKPLQEYVEVSV
jgi:nitrogen regulatory protein PII